jgi:hypothetical protein
MILMDLISTRSELDPAFEGDIRACDRLKLEAPGCSRLERQLEASEDDESESFAWLTAYNRHSGIEHPEVLDLVDVMEKTEARRAAWSLVNF